MDKKIEDMTNRELFCVLTGTEGVLEQARLQRVVRLYIRHSQLHGEERDKDLRTMVREYLEGVYDDVSADVPPAAEG